MQPPETVPLTTRWISLEHLAWAFLNGDDSVPVSRNLLREEIHAVCTMKGSWSLKDKCQVVLLLGHGCRGPLSQDGSIPPTKLEGTLGSFLLLPASLDCHLPEHVSAITHCPPGRAEPHHFAGGAGCCQWQRRMTYLLACQNLPCLWKSHPAKQNSQLPIGSPRGPC